MNRGFEYRERIGRDAAGLRVLDWLTRRYPHSRPAAWQARLRGGELSLDQALASENDTLRFGQALHWRRPPWEEPEVPLGFAVLYRDDELLAVAKPRGLPSVPNGGFFEHTLLHCVRLRFPEAVPMHRLGRGTSGILLFARTSAARRAVAAAWRSGLVEKEYRALVRGLPARGSFTIETPIGRVAHPRLGEVHAASPAGKPAVSHVRVLGACDGDALVSVGIPTGRPHQIRIHLAAAGHPLLGDPLYVEGGVPGPDPGLPGEGGYRLHAYRLALPHPVSGLRIEIECAPPAALRLDLN